MEQLQNASDVDHLNYYFSDQFATHRHIGSIGVIVGLYTVVAVLGFTANVVVFGTLVAIGGLRHSATNMFVGSLAFSDMMLCCFNVPIQLYYELMEPRISSSFASIDRYRSILFPRCKRISDVFASNLLVMSIAFSVMSAFPVGYYSELDMAPILLNMELSENMTFLPDFESKFPKYCIERWPHVKLRLVYSIVVFVCQFLAPLMCTGVLYWRIGSWLTSQRLYMPGAAERSNNSANLTTKLNELQNGPSMPSTTALLSIRIEQRTKRTHRILISIVVCFCVCWTPWMFYVLYLEWYAFSIKVSDIFDEYQIGNASHGLAHAENAHMKLIELFLKLFALSSTCANPFLYGWLNENIRKSLIRAADRMMCHRRKLSPTNNPHMELNTFKNLTSQGILKTSSR